MENQKHVPVVFRLLFPPCVSRSMGIINITTILILGEGRANGATVFSGNSGRQIPSRNCHPLR